MAPDRTTTDPQAPLSANAPITDPARFLEMPAEQLDLIFRNASVGAIPEGQGEGTAIVAPGTAISDDIARFVHIFQWKGKVFERDPSNPLIVQTVRGVGYRLVATTAAAP